MNLGFSEPWEPWFPGNPGSLGTWFLGTLVPGFLGTLVPGFLGTLGTLEPMELWFPEPRVPRTLGCRRGGGALEGSADEADGSTGGGCCHSLTVDGCLCMEHRTRCDLIE